MNDKAKIMSNVNEIIFLCNFSILI